MKLTVLGTASPLPTPGRAQTGFLLEKDERLLLLDCGSGAFARLTQLEVDWQRLDTVLLTHHHLDHTSDLLTVLLARGLMGFPQARVCGPPGTVAWLERWLEAFPSVRQFVELTPRDVRPGEELQLVGFQVETLAMRHFIPTLSYKLDRKLVICGDSEPLPTLREFVRGCRALIHECSFPDGGASPPGHATPGALGRVLAGAQVEQVWLSHFFPPALQDGPALVEALQPHVAGQVGLASDLQRLEL